MKKLTVAILACILTAGVAAADRDAAKIKADIDALMTNFHKAAAMADARTYFGLMAPGAFFLGTDITERWTKEAFEAWAQPRFKGKSAWVYWARSRNIFLSADTTVAWLDEDLESASYWPCRGTAVLEKIGGQWKIRHYSLTFTIPNSAVPDIKPVVLREFGKGPEK